MKYHRENGGTCAGSPDIYTYEIYMGPDDAREILGEVKDLSDKTALEDGLPFRYHANVAAMRQPLNVTDSVNLGKPSIILSKKLL